MSYSLWGDRSTGVTCPLFCGDRPLAHTGPQFLKRQVSQLGMGGTGSETHAWEEVQSVRSSYGSLVVPRHVATEAGLWGLWGSHIFLNPAFFVLCILVRVSLLPTV